MMTEHPRETLSAYVDGELSPAEHVAVEAHLASCGECREIVADIRRLEEMPRDQEHDELTTQRFLAEHRNRRTNLQNVAPSPDGVRRRKTGLVTSLLAVAALFIVAVAYMLIPGKPIRDAFSTAPSYESSERTATMGQNQAALSAGIY